MSHESGVVQSRRDKSFRVNKEIFTTIDWNIPSQLAAQNTYKTKLKANYELKSSAKSSECIWKSRDFQLRTIQPLLHIFGRQEMNDEEFVQVQTSPQYPIANYLAL